MDKVVRVEPKASLLSRAYIFALSAAVSSLPMSRREVLNFGSDTLYDWIGWGGIILTGEGEPIEIYPGVFDDVHGEDGSGVWISAMRGRRLPQRRPRQTLLGRLQLYDAMFRIMGRPVRREARRAEIALMRGLLRKLNSYQREEYLAGIAQLRCKYIGPRHSHYAAAIRRLRIEIASNS